MTKQTPGISSCPACGSDGSRRWGGGSGEPIHLCNACGTTFFSRPITRPHDYGTYYPYLATFDAERLKWEVDQRRPYVNFQLRVIERLNPPGRRLIDFGGGPGYFCAAARDAGWDASAIESSQAAIDTGVTKYGVDYTSLDQLADGSCSVFTAFHVIEHLDDPKPLLEALRRKLAPGGVLVVHVPNRESLSALLRYGFSRISHGSNDRFGCLYYPEHITGFTEAGLEACAKRAGFDLLRVRERTTFSRFYDPWLMRNYLYDANGRRNPLKGGLRLAVRVVKGLVDLAGSVFGRGDWIVAHFRVR